MSFIGNKLTEFVTNDGSSPMVQPAPLPTAASSQLLNQSTPVMEHIYGTNQPIPVSALPQTGQDQFYPNYAAPDQQQNQWQTTSYSDPYAYNTNQQYAQQPQYPGYTSETSPAGYNPYAPTDSTSAMNYGYGQNDTNQNNMYGYELGTVAPSSFDTQAMYPNQTLQTNFESTTSAPSNTNNNNSNENESSYLDDLGFGNNSLKKPTDENNSKQKDKGKEVEKSVEQRKAENRGSFIGAVITKLWPLGGSKDATSSEPKSPAKPTDVHLGESMSMVFDPVTKRWINPSAKPVEQKQEAPPAPPTDAFISRPPTAPPSTPNGGSIASSRAASPAPGQLGPRTTSRRGARSRCKHDLHLLY